MKRRARGELSGQMKPHINAPPNQGAHNVHHPLKLTCMASRIWRMRSGCSLSNARAPYTDTMDAKGGYLGTGVGNG